MTGQKSNWYREPYVWLIISFPLAAVIGGIITLMIAIKSDDGLVVDDYYKQGLEINKLIARDETAVQYDIEARLQLSEQDEQFRIFLSGNHDFVSPKEIQVNFLHATRSGFDKILNLSNTDTNFYTGILPPLIPGKWHIQIEADDWRVLETISIR